VRAGRAQERHGFAEESSTIVEDGFTLVEVLIALSILSIVMFVVVGGMNLLVVSSVLNRSQGDSQSVLGRAAEAVSADPYVRCDAPGFSASSYPLGMPATASLLPENVKGGHVKLPFITKITGADGTKTLWSPATGVLFVNCTGHETDLQVIQIEVDATTTANTGSVSQTVYVVRSP
jgi:prepilin-type N-terminal cleavage/methylation domain-containing protein